MPRNPFRTLIGAKVLEAGHGHCLVLMPGNETTLNQAGVVHGGAVCTLADAAMSTALRSALKPGDTAATIEMKVNFIAPGRGDLLAAADLLHQGGTTAVTEVEIRNTEQQLVAKGLATFHVKRGAQAPRTGARTAMDPEMDGPEPEE